jgi:hypothetical protein
VLREEFSDADRQQAFRDLQFFNKYAQNCAPTSAMQYFIGDRVSFKGPERPPEDWDVEIPEPVQQLDKKGKPIEVAQPELIERSEEAEQADKLVRKFLKQFMPRLLELQFDLNQFRSYHQSVQKVALWPKVLTKAEREAEELRRIQEEELERKRKEEEERKKAEEANQKGKKGAPVVKPDTASTSRSEAPQTER